MINARYLFILLFGMVYAGAGFSAETHVDLRVGEIYSSNILLVPDDEAVSDFVTRINPSLTFDEKGRFVDVLVDYNYEALLYSRNSVLNEDYHKLDSSALVRLIGDELTASGQAVYTQVNVDPRQPQADSNIPVTGNRTDGLYWGAGAQWIRELPLNSQIDASYLYGQISYDDPGLQTVDTQTVSLRLETDSKSRSSLSYVLDYNYWFYDYETSGDVKDQNLYFSLSQEVVYGFSLIGLAGLDSDFADPQDSTLSEFRWEAGVEYSNTEGNLMVMIGERYFGKVLRLKAGRTLADLSFSASYAEEPGTAESVFLQQGASEVPIDDDSLDTSPPPPGIDQPGSATRFLGKRADGNVRWEGFKSDLVFNVWWDRRDNLPDSTAFTTVPTDRDESLGAGLYFDMETGARTSISLEASAVRREFTEVIVDESDTLLHDIDNWRIGGGVSYQLGLKTTLESSLAFYKSQGREAEDNFKEFQASIDVVREF